MNPTIETFARSKVKEGLLTLTPEQQDIFRRMYAHKNPEFTPEQVVDNMPADKLDWALTQIENTIKKFNP